MPVRHIDYEIRKRDMPVRHIDYEIRKRDMPVRHIDYEIRKREAVSAWMTVVLAYLRMGYWEE